MAKSSGPSGTYISFKWGLRIILGTLVLSVVGCTLPPPRVPGSATVSPNFVPDRYARVAVFVQDHTGYFGVRTRHHGVLRHLESEFMGGVIGKGYSVASRSDVQHLMDEMRLQEDRITEEAAARLGRLLNVPAVILVDVNNVNITSERVQYTDGRTGTVHYAHASAASRLLAVASGEVLWTASVSLRTRTESQRREEQLPLLTAVARNLAAHFPPRVAPSVDPTSGATPD